MISHIFSQDERKQIEHHGMKVEEIASQIEMFKRGFAFTKLHRPCTLHDGITVIEPENYQKLFDMYAAAAAAGRVMKFVPASGAASRMFRALLAVYSRYESSDAPWVAGEDADTQDFLQFIKEIKRFAFYDDLHAVLAVHGLDLEAHLAPETYKTVLEYFLTPQGLNYANLPKGLLKFHRYADHCRTPFEEHLVEAAAYTQDANGMARLHCTITPEHSEAAASYLEAVKSRYEAAGVRYEISFSTQKMSTDTIAVDLENRPFHDHQGQLVFRPAGHGALLANLSDLQGDIIFIKNIDNVVPDRLKDVTYTSKRLLGGYLVALQQTIFAYLQQLAEGDVDTQRLGQMLAFARQQLSIVPPADIAQRPPQEQQRFLFTQLHRPLRVCGMVKNAGEPGGGPFWVEQADGTLSLQIVESSQVDMSSAEQRACFAAATHFNPVDLVCGVKNYRGQPFELPRFVDPTTGFISQKSYEGRDLKALELPGLWNGAMADWNTVFIEVPSLTFNPVKTVLDLLRQEHQPAVP